MSENTTFEKTLSLNRLMLHFCRSLAADIDDADFARQPFVGANHPAWVLGHLALVADSAGKMLGLEPRAPAGWDALFGRGSAPTENRAAYPSKETLLAAVEANYARLAEAAQSATAEQLAAPHNAGLLKKALPTAGDLLAMILSTHMAQHLGQFSAWRRAMGKAPLF